MVINHVDTEFKKKSFYLYCKKSVYGNSEMYSEIKTRPFD